MAKPFDATLNQLIDAHAADWAEFLCGRLGIPAGPVEVLDTDLSTTLQADKLLCVLGANPVLLHLELKSTGRLGIPTELLRYNVLAHAVNELPVHTFSLLLRPKATATDLTGELSIAGADGQPYLIFRYGVVRVWQESVDARLSGGVGLAPLALLTNEASADLPGAFGRFQRRLRQANLPANLEQGLYGATFVLCGLRYDPGQIEQLYQGLSMPLEDSTTYQLILRRGEDRGRTQEAQDLLLRIGRRRFRDPSSAVETALREITDRARLERMAERIFDATGWDDLLATP